MTLSSEKRILVVEDQKEIRSLLARQLEGAGFSVATAENGTVALALLEKEDFDLIISDMVMPGPIQGQDLAKSVCEKISDQKFIFLSGYAEHLCDREYSVVSKFPKLAKPIFRAELIAAVRKVLSG